MLRPYVLGIKFVFRPLTGIVDDIFADFFQFSIVTNDMFMKIALPNSIAWRAALKINHAGGGGFESTDNCRQRARNWFPEALNAYQA